MAEVSYTYRCKRCGWQGPEQKLDSELVDTCIGDDPIYICPECGSYEVVIVKTETSSDKSSG
ncbi:MAG: hypothetical protein GXO47_13110 [Chlorobi bacterium]|nr:hypothetical protein [Chlorobiota bacterium]